MKIISKLLMLFCVVLALAGCWSNTEMESQAYILVLGIDKGSNTGVKIYAQVGKPAQSRTEDEQKPMFQTLTGEGRNMSEAFAALFLETTKRPDLSHIQLLLFSKEIAAQGVQETLDFIRRDFSVRENIKVAIAEESLEKLLTVETKLGNQPALAIINQFLIGNQRSTAIQVDLKDFISQLLEPDRQAVLPMVGSGEDGFTLGKSAVFSGYKLATVLSVEDTFGLLLWRDLIKKGTVTVPLPASDDVASFKIISSQTTLSTSWNNDRLVVHVNVEATLDIQEMVRTSSELLKGGAQNYFVQRLKGTLNVAQRTGLDFLGFSAGLRREDPKAWRRMKDWPKILQEAEYDFSCQVLVRGQGPVR